MGFLTNALSETNPYEAKAVNLEGHEADFQKAIEQAQAVSNQAIHNQGYVSDQGNALIQALQAQAAGQGPSVAQNQLNQETSRNINRGVAQAASVKGVDPALAAKMGLDFTQNANQEAIGQGATLRAQERLGALGQLGGAINSQTQANLGIAGLGGQQALGYGNLQNTQNANQIQNQLGAQGINAKIAAQNAQERSATATAIGNSISQGASSAATMAYKGGEIGYADGGQVAQVFNPESLSWINDEANSPAAKAYVWKPGGGSKTDSGPSKTSTYQGSSQSDYTGLSDVRGSNPGDYMNLYKGGPALVPGDSPKNDIIPARLSPGEIVIPRSITQSPEAAEKAAAFVDAIKKSHKPDEKVEYRHIVACMGGRV